MFTRLFLRRLLYFTAVAAAFAGGACGKDGPTTPSPSTNGTLRVTAVSPASGSTTGGTIVTISGAGFTSDATVTVGGVAATQVTYANATTINAVVAPRPTAGSAEVVVTSSGRSATLASGFTFVAPSGNNRPPAITITGTPPRANQPQGFANLGDVFALGASVTDSETAPASLAYEWTGPGSFGTQTISTNWTLPATASTPSSIVATLRATETFTEGGITHRNVSAPATFTLQLHDSQKAVLDLGDDFLTLFSQSSIPTDTVLRGFSATCDGGAGRSAEKNDVDRSRLQYRQDFSKFRMTRVTPVTLNFRGSCPVPGRASQRNVDACASFVVHWEIEYIQNVDADRRIGTKEVTDGTDYVSAVFENNQWRLCHSDFVGTSVIPKLNIRRVVSW